MRKLLARLFGKKETKVEVQECREYYWLRDLDNKTFEKISYNTYYFLKGTEIVGNVEIEYEDKYQFLAPTKDIILTISRKGRK